MGCKCANSHEEEEEEIKVKGIKEENINETQPKSSQCSPNINDSKHLNYLNNNIYNTTNSNNTEKINNELQNENLQQNNNNKYINKNIKYSNYPEKVVELINNIRQDPPIYADIIEDSISIY